MERLIRCYIQFANIFNYLIGGGHSADLSANQTQNVTPSMSYLPNSAAANVAAAYFGGKVGAYHQSTVSGGMSSTMPPLPSFSTPQCFAPAAAAMGFSLAASAANDCVAAAAASGLWGANGAPQRFGYFLNHL